MNSLIPTLDLNDFKNGTEAQRHAFVQALGKAYEEIGFIAVKNHGLDDALRDKLYTLTQAFFALPDEVKMQYRDAANHGQRGYTPKGEEHAKGRNTGDLKEFYHVGRELEPTHPDYKLLPPNIFPDAELPEFRPVTLQAYTILEEAGRQILRAISLFLGLEERYFDDKILNGDSILRPIHYYPIEDPDSIPADAVRSAEHEDINLITLLMGASAEGLQVLTREGEWVAITAVPECLVVNVGDMLQRLTNNKLVSTTHRVVNPPREKMGTSRFSIPFFLHPRREMDLTCLPSCVDADHPKRYEDYTAGQYLMERLEEIGLIKK